MVEQLSKLADPLQIHKPNKYKLISMDIPICKGDLCYCVDVLDALTKDFFARKGNPVEETAELGNSFARKLYKCSILLIAFKQNALYTYLRSVKTRHDN